MASVLGATSARARYCSWRSIFSPQRLNEAKSAELRPLDEWATLNAVTCGEKKYFFLGHLRVYYPSDIDSRVGVLLAECVEVLRDDASRCSTRLDRLMIRGVAERSNDEQLEDIDGLLRMLTDLMS